jgi:hypothetical protein
MAPLPWRKCRLSCAGISWSLHCKIRSKERMIGEEKTLPKRLRHPRGECSRDQKATNDVHPDRCPIHNEVLADRRNPFLRCNSMPQRTLGHRHVHVGHAFHASGNASWRCPMPISALRTATLLAVFLLGRRRRLDARRTSDASASAGGGSTTFLTITRASNTNRQSYSAQVTWYPQHVHYPPRCGVAQRKSCQVLVEVDGTLDTTGTMYGSCATGGSGEDCACLKKVDQARYRKNGYALDAHSQNCR